MKKLWTVLLAVLLAAGLCQPALAADGEPTVAIEADGEQGARKCTYTFPDGGALYFKQDSHSVTAPDGTVDHWEPESFWTLYDSENLKGRVVIPEAIDGQPVEKMYYHQQKHDWLDPAPCLEDNPELTSITFPAALKEIIYMQGRPTFKGCGKLTEVLFEGEGPEKLTGWFFEGAPALRRVKLPKAVADLDLAFVGCPGLDSLELDPQNPHFVMDEQNILYSADKARVITAAMGARERETVTLPETVAKLESHAFAGNEKLKSVYGGAPNIKGDTGCFRNCPALLPFRDMHGHWAEDAAAWGYQKSVIYGASLFTFDPDTPVDRGMAAAMLHRLVGLPDIYNEGFPDVNNQYHYYGGGVMWCKEKGIVQGCSDGLYHPELPVTREQLAAILYRYCLYMGRHGSKGDLSAFPDAGSVSPYAQEAMEWAVGSGLMKGKNGGLLDPQGQASRAEAILLFRRMEDIPGIPQE